MAPRIAASRTSWLAWAVFATACLMTLAGDWLAWLDRDAGVPQRYATSAADVIIGLAFLVVPAMGALIASRHPRNPVGWLLCAAGLAYALHVLTQGYAVHALLGDPGALPGGRYVAWLEESTRLFAIPLVGTFGVLLFPTGRLPSRRWRPAAWLATAMFAGLLVRFAFGTQDDFPFLENPFAPPGSSVLQIANAFEVAYLLLPLSLIVSAASLIWRWRASTGDERQQVKWVSAAAAMVALAFVLCLIVSAVDPDRASDVVVIPEFLATMLLSAATAVAILKHRLYDLDLVINRAAVYALLSAALIAVYVGAVALLGDLLGEPRRAGGRRGRRRRTSAAPAHAARRQPRDVRRPRRSLSRARAAGRSARGDDRAGHRRRDGRRHRGRGAARVERRHRARQQERLRVDRQPRRTNRDSGATTRRSCIAASRSAG